MAKQYCYVDETGLDTLGDLFIVGVVIADERRDQITLELEAMEHQSGKGRIKWNKTGYDKRIAYIDGVLRLSSIRGKLFYAVHHNSATSYLQLTASTIGKAIRTCQQGKAKSVVLIDGLPDSQVDFVVRQLRAEKLSISKVRGIKREEHDAPMRLADALCGFVRAVVEEQPRMQVLFERRLSAGVLVNVLEK